MNTCVVIETLKTEYMSTKNVNKNETKRKATHKRTQHNAKKLTNRHLHLILAINIQNDE